MTRNRRAWELDDLTIRIVRNMLLHDDVDSLLETGTGTPDEAALMVRCYELAAMELWDESALIEAATVAGIDDGFTLSGESPERIHRKIAIAMKTNSAPEYMPPPDGIKLLCRLGVLVYDELEETVTRFAAIGRYETPKPHQTAPATDTATPAPVGAVGASGGVMPDKEAPLDKGWVMKKAALIKKHAARWPTINRDFQDASENDLSKVAKAPGHGEWFEAAALNWAGQRGKFEKEKEQGLANLATVWPSTKHTIEG